MLFYKTTPQSVFITAVIHISYLINLEDDGTHLRQTSRLINIQAKTVTKNVILEDYS